MKPNYILSESLMSTISVYLILKKLMQPYAEWDACKLGIIDKTGKKLRHPVTASQREAWDMLTRLCWNIKKISTRFVGAGKFAQYFSAAYLLKDSLSTYIKINQEHLNEGLLSDMTFYKQNCLYTVIKNLPEHNNLAMITHNNLETEIFKILTEVENLLETNSEINLMFEDGTVAGDIAQTALPILGSKRNIDPLKLVKPDLKKLKKRKKKNEDN